MSQPIRQESFIGGEVAKEYYGKTRDARYGVSLKTCKNFLPLHRGALINRSGFQLIYGDGLHTFNFGQARVVPFIFSDQSTAVLLFYAFSVVFIVNGRLLETAPNSGTLYRVVTPYAAADLARLKFAQSGDVVTITHPSYAPQDLTRTALRTWAIAASALAPPAGFYPASVTMAANGFAGDNATAYSAAHALYSSGDYVNDGIGSYICILPNNSGAPKAPSTNPAYWALAVDASHSPRIWSWVVTVLWRDSNGILRESLPTPAPASSFTVLASDRPCIINFTAPANPGFPYKIVGYGVYRGRNGLYGFISQTDPTQTSFKDDGAEPNFSIQPPKGTNPFKVADGNNTDNTIKYPGVVAYHEQRRVYMRTDAKLNHFIGSRQGDFTNFDINPIETLDTDSYDWAVSSQELEEIRSAVSLDQLVLLTGQGEFTAEGTPGKSISPNSVRARRHSRHGSSYLSALTVGNAIIFNTAKGNYIRDLIYSFQVNRLDGIDLTVNARHLFDGFTIVDWCYTAVPYPILWVVRSDGALISCTYDRERQVVAWAQHPSSLGTIESICSVPEGTEDAVYILRNYDGANRYPERLASRFFTDLRKAVFLDAAVVFDGRVAGVLGTVTVSGASYGPLDAVALAASNGVFVTGVGSTDIGDRVVLDPDGMSGGPYPVTINGIVDGQHATGVLEAALDSAFQNVATASWAWARDHVPGITTLANKAVMVLADGAPQGPFVIDGTGLLGPLSPPAVVMQIGIAYNSDLETLDVAAEGTRRNVKSVEQVVLEVADSVGFSAGKDLDHLHAAKTRKAKDNFGAPVPFTGQVPVRSDSGWTVDGRIAVRQASPLPITITAIIRDIEIGGPT